MFEIECLCPWYPERIKQSYRECCPLLARKENKCFQFSILFYKIENWKLKIQFSIFNFQFSILVFKIENWKIGLIFNFQFGFSKLKIEKLAWFSIFNLCFQNWKLKIACFSILKTQDLFENRIIKWYTDRTAVPLDIWFQIGYPKVGFWAISYIWLGLGK